MIKFFYFICLTLFFVKATRIGLANTGNSCFLNSALQVLSGTENMRLALIHEDVSDTLDNLRAEIEAINAEELEGLNDNIKEILKYIKEIKAKLKKQLNFDEKIKELMSKGMEEHEAVSTDEIRSLQMLIDEGLEVKEYEKLLKPFFTEKSAIESRRTRVKWVDLIIMLSQVIYAKHEIESGINHPETALEDALYGLKEEWHNIAHTDEGSQGDSGEVLQQFFETLATLNSDLFKRLSDHVAVQFIQGNQNQRITSYAVHASVSGLDKDLLTLDEIIDTGAKNFGGVYESFSDILFIRINRLKNNDAELEKMLTPVDIPKVYKTKGEVYHLYGIISHSSDSNSTSENSGHIVCFIKDLARENGYWRLFNDEFVTEGLHEDVILQIPEVKSTVTSLFYVKESSLKTIFPSSLEWFQFCVDLEYLKGFTAQFNGSDQIKDYLQYRLQITALTFSAIQNELNARMQDASANSTSHQESKELDKSSPLPSLPTIAATESKNHQTPVTSSKRGAGHLDLNEQNQLKKQKTEEDQDDDNLIIDLTEDDNY